TGRLPRPERRGQNDHAQNAFRPALSHERRGPSPRLRPLGTQGRLSAPVRAVARPEKSTLVGPASARITRTERQNLRYRKSWVRADRRGNDGTARGERQTRRDGARTVAGRADENGVDCFAAAPAKNSFPRR